MFEFTDILTNKRRNQNLRVSTQHTTYDNMNIDDNFAWNRVKFYVTSEKLLQNLERLLYTFTCFLDYNKYNYIWRFKIV